MIFVRKSLIRKLFVYLVLFASLIGGVVYYFFQFGEGVVPLEVFAIAMGVFLSGFLLIYYFDVVRPMRVILTQVQNLLNAQKAKKVMNFRFDEIGAFATFFNRVTESFKSVSSNLKDRDRMIEELSVASQLQRDILPLTTPIVKGLQVVAKNKPASEVGGDSFNVFTIKDKTYIYLGDVTGHGVAAGLVMTMVNSLISAFSEMCDSAYEIVVMVNKYIKRHIKKAMFMTMVMLSWDSSKNKLSYVGAGHEYILIYRADSGEVEAIQSGGIALGMVPDNSNHVQEKEIELDYGDFVILYSDGISEARNNDDVIYGLENMKKSIRNHAPEYSAEGLNYHIAKDVSDYMGEHLQDDDMTLIVIQRIDEKADVAAQVDQSTTWNE